MLFLASVLLGGLLATSQPIQAQQAAAPDARPAELEIVGIYRDGTTLLSTGLVVGVLPVSGAGSNDGRVKRVVLVPKAALAEVSSINELSVRAVGPGAEHIPVSPTPFDDFEVLLRSRADIGALARASGVGSGVATTWMRQAADAGAVQLITLDEARQAAGPSEVYVTEQTCELQRSRGNEELVTFSDGRLVRSAVPRSGAGSEIIGGLVMSDCDGRPTLDRIVQAVRNEQGGRPVFIKLGPIVHGLKLWVRQKMPDLAYQLRVRAPRFVDFCPAAPDRLSAQIARVTASEETGDFTLRVLDIPTTTDEPVSELQIGSLQRQLNWDVAQSWGNAGESPEFYIFRAESQQRFILDRICKSNLSLRGRIVGEGATSVSRDSGIEFGADRFALRLNPKLTVLTGPRLRHGLLVNSFPEAASATRIGRLAVSEFDDPSDGVLRQSLIGFSPSKGAIYFAVIPSDRLDASGEEAEVAGVPALKLGQPIQLDWERHVFELRTLGWSQSVDAVPDVEMHPAGRFIALAGDGGVALLSLDADANPKLEAAFGRAEEAGDALARKLGSGRFEHVASTVARVPGSADFLIVAIYCSADARDGNDFMAVVPVRSGTALPPTIIDMGAQIRERVTAIADALPNAGADRIVNARPKDGTLTLVAAASLERLWGTLVINVQAERGQPGLASRATDLAFAYPLHSWFNRFDRIWETPRPALPVNETKNLCERFDFNDLNVITHNGAPTRVIATVDDACTEGATAGTSLADDGALPHTRTLAIRDFIFDRMRPTP